MPPLNKGATLEQIEARAIELKQQGKKYKDAVAAIEAETGKQFSEREKDCIKAPYLEDYYRLIRERELKKPGLSFEPPKRSEHNEAILQEPAPDISRAEEGPERSETQQLFPENWEEKMRQIAREVYQESGHNIPNGPLVFNHDAPPEPQTLKGARGRKEDRQIKKISATIDEVLWGLFEVERKRRGLSTGRLLDIILWQWYGKPKLSYGEEQEDV